ncbi:MAG: hypothetical protein RIT26_1139 [Pseudomonadota bacterium]|jgi:hypothetical protein
MAAWVLQDLPRRQRKATTPLILSLCGALSACQPALNWRDISFDDQPGKLLLPCKPDRAERQVELGETRSRLRMMGCEAQDMHFTWSRLDLPRDAAPALVLRAWQQASLSALGADPALASKALEVSIVGARLDVPPRQLQAHSESAHHAHFIWWIWGGQGHQLAVYSTRQPVTPAVLQILKEGIRLP